MKSMWTVYYCDHLLGRLIESGDKWLYPEENEPFQVKYVIFIRECDYLVTNERCEWEVGSYEVDYTNKRIILGNSVD